MGAGEHQPVADADLEVDRVLDGDLDAIVDALATQAQAEALEGGR